MTPGRTDTIWSLSAVMLVTVLLLAFALRSTYDCHMLNNDQSSTPASSSDKYSNSRVKIRSSDTMALQSANRSAGVVYGRTSAFQADREFVLFIHSTKGRMGI